MDSFYYQLHGQVPSGDNPESTVLADLSHAVITSRALKREIGRSENPKAVADEISYINLKIASSFSALCRTYEQRGMDRCSAEFTASAKYQKILKSLGHKLSDVELNFQIDRIADDAMQLLRSRITDCEQGRLFEEIIGQGDERKTKGSLASSSVRALLHKLLEEPPTIRIKSGGEVIPDLQKSNLLRRVIRGFIIEFVRQTERSTEACNVFDGQNPQAEKYWEKQPVGAFRAACFGSWFHAAATFQQLYVRAAKEGMLVGDSKKEVVDILGATIRACLDSYLEGAKELFPSFQLRASVYNRLSDIRNGRLRADIGQKREEQRHVVTREPHEALS